jgi:hypothetical protein
MLIEGQALYVLARQRNPLRVLGTHVRLQETIRKTLPIKLKVGAGCWILNILAK